MNIWLAAAAEFLVALGICGLAVCRSRRPGEALVALQMAGTLAIMILMLMAEAFQRPSFFDLALALTLVSLPGMMVYAYFVERWFP